MCCAPLVGIVMSFVDKAYACLAGLALGDALGMPTEFLTPGQITEHFGWVEDFGPAPEWHPHSRMEPGEITDDTGQALAIAHAYAGDGALRLEAVVRELLAWAEAMPEDKYGILVGPSTSQALEAIQAGSPPEKSGASGKTNGGSMRVAPVGIVQRGDIIGAVEDAHVACIPTHNTTVAIAGSGAVAAAIGEALKDDSTLESITNAGKVGARRGRKKGAWAWGTRLENRIELAEEIVRGEDDEKKALRRLYEYVGVDMLVAESIATAFGIVILAKGDPMKACVLGANAGGDTDTIAAVSGAICGAWRGMRDIDQGLLKILLDVNNLDLYHEAQRLVHIAKGK